MSGIIGGAGSKSGVIVPPIVGCKVQPNGSSTHTLANGNNHVFGWTASGTNAGNKGTFIKHITFGSHSGLAYLHDGAATGLITIQYSGMYFVHCDIRIENSPGAGNVQMVKNEAGTIAHRMHTQSWAEFNYGHSTNRGCFDLVAGDTLRFHIAVNGGQIQGYADTVNYLSIMRIP